MWISLLLERNNRLRAVLQRVSEASVAVGGSVIARINAGILVLVGIGEHDTKADADHLARKITTLRIFPDDNGKMNKSLQDVSGELLIVSQFTLYGDMRRGNRPSYATAAQPELAHRLYDYFVDICRNTGILVRTGVFQAHMKVELTNDGPVTLFYESESHS